MKLIDVLKWEGEQKAVVLVYADASSDLSTTMSNNGKTLTLTKGSMAYLANGDVYVLGSTWTKVGA